MIYMLLYPLRTDMSALNVFGYITFRSAMAALTALLMSLFIGPWLIRRLREFQIGQTVREEGPTSHKQKAGTPTMGGVLILLCVLMPCFLWIDLTSPFFWILAGTMTAFGLIGFLDDFIKIRRRRSLGLTTRQKLAAQIAVSLIVGVLLVSLASRGVYSTEFSLPFVKEWSPDLSWYYLIPVLLILVSSSNAVNLTDGLDGLAIGTVLIAISAYTVLTYVSGHAQMADYLLIPHIKGTAELTIFCGAMLGASLGFLWFNSHPAEIFMGDVGSLALGGAIGMLAILIKQELLLLLVGGIFVLEVVSVIVQVSFFKLTGRRAFRMAPRHHHFELVGWTESKVITRFWILGMICALAALSTLKLR